MKYKYNKGSKKFMKKLEELPQFDLELDQDQGVLSSDVYKITTPVNIMSSECDIIGKPIGMKKL